MNSQTTVIKSFIPGYNKATKFKIIKLKRQKDSSLSHTNISIFYHAKSSSILFIAPPSLFLPQTHYINHQKKKHFSPYTKKKWLKITLFQHTSFS